LGLKERLWNLTYLGHAPWDIGEPRPELVRLVEGGKLEPWRAIDLGCGTGENAIYLSKEGFEVTGVDLSSRAITKANRKARRAGVSPTLLIGDVTNLTGVEGTFDLAVDNGCLHSMLPSSRPIYTRTLLRLTQPGSRYFLRCFQKDPNQRYFFLDSFLKGFGILEPDEVERLFDSQFEIESHQSLEPSTKIDAVYLMSRLEEN